MNDPAAAYRNTSFEAAPPLKILRMLYAGALKFLDQAKACELPDESIQFSDRLARADAIVSELRCSLEPERAPDLAQQLDSLYEYVQGELSRAILEREPEPIENAYQVLASLKQAWDQLEVDDATQQVA